MWFWKKKDDKKNKGDQDGKKADARKPEDREVMLNEMERELDRMVPGLGRVFREIERELEKSIPEMFMMVDENSKAGRRPMYRGIHIVVGPDGVPRVREFSGAEGPMNKRGKEGEYKEPLVDVFEGEEEITITAELPGVKEEDINVNVDGKRVEILAEDDGPFKYKKVVELRDFISPRESRATFNNSILEINARKSGRPEKGKIAIG